MDWYGWHGAYWEEDYYDDCDCPSPPVVITITAGEKDYVTIHDSVSQLHPWLFEHRNTIVRSMDAEDPPLSEELVVDVMEVTEFRAELLTGWPAMQRALTERWKKWKAEQKC